MIKAFRKQTKLWTTKNGTRIRICDMSYSHLKNAIAMLERKAKYDHEEAINSAYECMDSFNGEMAQLSMQSIAVSLRNEGWESVFDYDPTYNAMKLDMERRNE